MKLNVGNTSFNVSPLTGLGIMALMLIYLLAICYWGVKALAFYTGMPSILVFITYLLLATKITLVGESQSRGLLPEWTTKTIGFLTACTTITFLIHQELWEPWQACLLFLPFFVSLINNIKKLS